MLQQAIANNDECIIEENIILNFIFEKIKFLNENIHYLSDNQIILSANL